MTYEAPEGDATDETDEHDGAGRDRMIRGRAWVAPELVTLAAGLDDDATDVPASDDTQPDGTESEDAATNPSPPPE